MKELYHIVPKGDGYHYLCENTEKDIYELWDKSMRGRPAHLKDLTFETMEEAKEFLMVHDIFDAYEPQMFWVNDDYAKELGYE